MRDRGIDDLLETPEILHRNFTNFNGVPIVFPVFQRRVGDHRQTLPETKIEPFDCLAEHETPSIALRFIGDFSTPRCLVSDLFSRSRSGFVDLIFDLVFEIRKSILEMSEIGPKTQERLLDSNATRTLLSAVVAQELEISKNVSKLLRLVERLAEECPRSSEEEIRLRELFTRDDGQDRGESVTQGPICSFSSRDAFCEFLRERIAHDVGGYFSSGYSRITVTLFEKARNLDVLSESNEYPWRRTCSEFRFETEADMMRGRLAVEHLFSPGYRPESPVFSLRFMENPHPETLPVEFFVRPVGRRRSDGYLESGDPVLVSMITTGALSIVFDHEDYLPRGRGGRGRGKNRKTVPAPGAPEKPRASERKHESTPSSRNPWTTVTRRNKNRK